MNNNYKKLLGKDYLENTIINLNNEVSKIIQKGKLVPKLVVLIVGNDYASNLYVNRKMNICKKIGFLSKIIRFPENTTYEKLSKCIKELNNDKTVHGILLQVPLPKKLKFKEEILFQEILPSKDIDCFHDENFGKIMKTNNFYIAPCTAKGIIKLIENNNIKVEGKNIVVIGTSNIVGKPTAIMLHNMNATVAMCNVYTKNLKYYTKNADIIITATGKIDVVTIEMVKNGVIIFDAGIIRDKNNKIRGDVNFVKISEKCSYITPVPGGIGPMTLAILMENLWHLYKKNI